LNSSGNVVLTLVPKRAPEEFKQLLVEVDPSSFEVKRMVIFERSGARMDFLLSNVRENYLAPDSQFQFTPPQGVIVKKARWPARAPSRQKDWPVTPASGRIRRASCP
jgi:outer membrane lipoprotein-sorting protein